MSTKIEFHVLQSFPPANLNRDDTNTPKDCEFGGVRRARISSQCIKRAVRLHSDFSRATDIEPGKRTRWLASDIKDTLIEKGKPADEAEKVAAAFIGKLLGGMDKSKPERSKVLFYISAEEQETIASHLVDNWQDAVESKFDDLIKDYKKTFGTRSGAPDIALFGRMLAEDPKLNLDAACQVAHAISTHKVGLEMDYYTAVDDLLPGEETGAGMMGLTGYNSATFYRYAAIDWEQLLVNLGGSADLARKTIEGFIMALVKAIPTGKQNSFAAQTLPGMVMSVVRSDGQAWSLANAFEEPVRPTFREGGYLGASVQRLAGHWQRLNAVYGDPDQPANPTVLLLEEVEGLNGLSDHRVDNLSGLIQQTLASLPQE